MRANAKNAIITFSAKGYATVIGLIDAPGVTVNFDSYGGFEVIDRPRNVGLVNWTGYQPMTMTVPVLFDNWESQASVENDCAALEAMAGRGPVAYTTQGDKD